MKARNIIAWILQALLAFAFVGAGYMKLTASAEMVKNFTAMGFPLWFMYFIGAAEVAGGIGLLVPRFTRLAALGLIIIMVGAVALHLFDSSQPASSAGGAVVLLLLLIAVYVLRAPRRALA